jgi:hypothetical protein
VTNSQRRTMVRTTIPTMRRCFSVCVREGRGDAKFTADSSFHGNLKQ